MCPLQHIKIWIYELCKSTVLAVEPPPTPTPLHQAVKGKICFPSQSEWKTILTHTHTPCEQKDRRDENITFTILRMCKLKKNPVDDIFYKLMLTILSFDMSAEMMMWKHVKCLWKNDNYL